MLNRTWSHRDIYPEEMLCGDPIDATVGTPLDGAFTASGSFGQYITVVPALDMVIAHKTAVPPPRNVTNERYFGTILPQAIAAGRSGG